MIFSLVERYQSVENVKPKKHYQMKKKRSENEDENFDNKTKMIAKIKHRSSILKFFHFL